MPEATAVPPARTRAPRRRWSDSRAFAAAVVAVLAMLTASLWWQHARSADRARADAMAQAQLRAAQLASASATAVDVLFRTVDTTSRELAAAYPQAGARGFDERVGVATRRLPPGAVLQVAVIGADGYLAYSTLGVKERLFLGDREHFKVHLDGGDSIFISRPVLGRVSGAWSIQFSRPIRQDGRLVGVLVLSVSPSYLHDTMAQVALGSDDAINVLRQSGEVLGRNRDLAAALGKAADPRRPFLGAKAPASGGYLAASEFDGVLRIQRWQRLPDYPVTVLLGLSASVALAPAERMVAEDRLQALFATGLLWAAAGLLVLFARRLNVQIRQREAMEFVAMNDPLTGIHSRLALMRHLDEAIGRARQGHARIGLLYLDLDGFKPVNDQHGHAAGDEVLKAVARRIQGCLRASDIAARIGGDEFVVVLEPLEHEAVLSMVSHRIAQALEAPLRLHGAEIRIGASIGQACFPEHGADAGALLRHADRGMYARKAQGRGHPLDPGPAPAAA